MTDRKPPGVAWESWVDRLIREAELRGDFDDLPGKGKPLPDIDRPRDELWWVRKKLEREEISVLPPALAVRKELDEARERIARSRAEREVRAIIEEINARIREVNRTVISGPPSTLMPLDVERTVEEWRRSTAESSESA